MQAKMTRLFRAVSLLAVAFSCLNAGILMTDLLMHFERLRTQYLIATAVAALMFGTIGAGVFGLHWSLNKIRSHSTSKEDRTAVAELAVPWWVLQIVLGALLSMTVVLAASAAIAMIGRLGQGNSIFG
jgi:hypothetical protein